jgi:hypothetical protein
MSEESNLSASQEAMVELWEEHTSYEFGAHSTQKTLLIPSQTSKPQSLAA